MRILIANENNGNPNEQYLFHGTKANSAKGIIDSNFDNRYFVDGAWGYGAYFADDPNKSHNYTE